MRPLLFLVTLALPSFALAQGALTPPTGAFSGGAPTATMKTLTQVEPRTPLEPGAPGVSPSMNGGLIIDEPGSYYLTGNLTVSSGNAIDIGSSNVTLDLNGFTLSSTADDAVVRGTAIYAPNNADHLIIRNGHISGDIIKQNNGTFTGRGFDKGIDAPSLSAVNMAASNTIVENVTVEGVMNNAIVLERPGSVIRSCTAYQCGGFGLRARVVTDSAASLCYYTAISGATVSNCEGSSTTTIGVFAGTATNCSGAGEDTGLRAETATNCEGSSYGGIGLIASRSAVGCSGTTTTGPYGLFIGNYNAATLNGVAENCHGQAQGAGIGVAAGVATNCYASSTAGTLAMKVAGTATACRAKADRAGGTAISAAIAVACTAESGTISAAHKYNMP